MNPKIKNDILDLFAVYKVFDAPDGLIDSLALYVVQQKAESKHEIFKIVSDKVDEVTKKRKEAE